MSAETLQTLTFAEFLAREQRGDVRHEFVHGRVYAMSGGTERHDLLAGLVYEALVPSARARGCRAFLSNRLVKLEGAGYYPDAGRLRPGGRDPPRNRRHGGCRGACAEDRRL